MGVIMYTVNIYLYYMICDTYVYLQHTVYNVRRIINIMGKACYFSYFTFWYISLRWGAPVESKANRRCHSHIHGLRFTEHLLLLRCNHHSCMATNSKRQPPWREEAWLNSRESWEKWNWKRPCQYWDAHKRFRVESWQWIRNWKCSSRRRRR